MGSIPTTSTNNNAAHRAAFLFAKRGHSPKGSDPFPVLLVGAEDFLDFAFEARHSALSAVLECRFVIRTA